MNQETQETPKPNVNISMSVSQNYNNFNIGNRDVAEMKEILVLLPENPSNNDIMETVRKVYANKNMTTDNINREITLSLMKYILEHGGRNANNNKLKKNMINGIAHLNETINRNVKENMKENKE